MKKESRIVTMVTLVICVSLLLLGIIELGLYINVPARLFAGLAVVFGGLAIACIENEIC